MDGENTSAEKNTPPKASDIAWAGDALVVTALVGGAAKALGVLTVPGMRGVASQSTVDAVETVSATLDYTFVALLALMIGVGAYELSRRRGSGWVSRTAVVAATGIILAVAFPACVRRLPTIPGITLALVASFVAIVASIAAIRTTHTRILGAVLGTLAFAGLSRPGVWILVFLASERANLAFYTAARNLAAVGVIAQTVGTLLTAVWLGTRSRTRGRLLANGAIAVSFVITYLAARDTGAPPSPIEAVLRGSLSQAAGMPLPYGLGSIQAFLIPATILLAMVAIVQRTSARTVLSALALALLSQGALDVPLQALAMVAAGVWTILAEADPRTMWSTLVPRAKRS